MVILNFQVQSINKYEKLRSGHFHNFWDLLSILNSLITSNSVLMK